MLCKEKRGACIQCYQHNCFTAFHVSCARQAGYYLKERWKASSNQFEQSAYCEKHSPHYFQQEDEENEGNRDEVAEHAHGLRPPKGQHMHLQSAAPKKQKKLILRVSEEEEGESRRAKGYHPHQYSATHPAIPDVILQKVLHHWPPLAATRRKMPFAIATAKYWALKRAHRRGAPLLKRLHFEPWASTVAMHEQSDMERVDNYAVLKALRRDLERVRMLINLCRKRDQALCKWLAVQRDTTLTTLFPLYRLFLMALEEMTAYLSESLLSLM